MSVIGRIVHRGQVENAVRDVLQEWLHTYLLGVEDENGIERGLTTRPVDWVRTTDPRSIPTRRLPTVAIISPGFGEAPEWDSGTDLGPTAAFVFQVSVAVYARGRANQRDEALDNAGLLIAAATTALVNKGQTNDLIGYVDLTDLDLGTFVDSSRERTLADAEAVFSVWVPDALTRTQGPLTPVPPETFPPLSEYTDADSVTVTTDRLDP